MNRDPATGMTAQEESDYIQKFHPLQRGHVSTWLSEKRRKYREEQRIREIVREEIQGK